MSWGSILSLAKVKKQNPPDMHPQLLIALVARFFKLPSIFFLDAWPFSAPMVVISDPQVAVNASTFGRYGLAKHSRIKKFTNYITGSKSLFTLDGTDWRAIRSMFNPAFGLGHLTSLASLIVEDCQIFCERLEDHAEQETTCLMEELGSRLTFDIIAKVVLGLNLNCQIAENQVYDLFRALIEWGPRTGTNNPFKLYDPRRPIMQLYYVYLLNREIRQIVRARYQYHGSSEKHASAAVDFALEEYSKQNGGATNILAVNQEFQNIIVDNTKTLLFAGYDTSSSTLCYIYILLSKHPAALSLIREEHDSTFSPNAFVAPEILKSNPQLLYKLPYTLAVIKEALRLYPPVSVVRDGCDEFKVPLQNGQRVSTKGFMVYINLPAIHRSEANFSSPDAFHPERFLDASSSPSDSDNPMLGSAAKSKSWFRPFNTGPHACIGQELAILELKIALVLTIRRFNFEVDYPELVGEERKVPSEVFGDRWYQVLEGTAKPKGHAPMKVRRRKVN